MSRVASKGRVLVLAALFRSRLAYKDRVYFIHLHNISSQSHHIEKEIMYMQHISNQLRQIGGSLITKALLPFVVKYGLLSDTCSKFVKKDLV